MGELERCLLKDNLQVSSLLPSVCWQRGEAVCRQDRSLLETRKVQLECVFQITLQKIINQHHNYSRACLSQCGAAHRGGRREWCCESALDSLGNVTGTLRPWALSPESLPQPACMAQPPVLLWAGDGSQAATPTGSAGDVPAAGLLLLPLLGLLDLLEGNLCPRATQAVGLPSSVQHSPRCGWHREILGEEKSMDSPSLLPSAQAGSNPAFIGVFPTVN